MGQKHADTLACRDRLAEDDEALGRWADAERLRRETLSRREAGAPRGPSSAGNLIALNQAISSLDRFLLLTGLSVVLFLGLPLAGAAYGRVRPVSGFRLRPGPWAGYVGAALLGLSAWVFVTELLILLYRLQITHFDAARAHLLRGQFEILRQSQYKLYNEVTEQPLPSDASQLERLIADGSGINAIAK